MLKGCLRDTKKIDEWIEDFFSPSLFFFCTFFSKQKTPQSNIQFCVLANMFTIGFHLFDLRCSWHERDILRGFSQAWEEQQPLGSLQPLEHFPNCGFFSPKVPERVFHNLYLLSFLFSWSPTCYFIKYFTAFTLVPHPKSGLMQSKSCYGPYAYIQELVASPIKIRKKLLLVQLKCIIYPNCLIKIKGVKLLM